MAKRRASGATAPGVRPEITGGRELGPDFDYWLSQIYLPRYSDETK